MCLAGSTSPQCAEQPLARRSSTIRDRRFHALDERTSGSGLNEAGRVSGRRRIRDSVVCAEALELRRQRHARHGHDAADPLLRRHADSELRCQQLDRHGADRRHDARARRSIGTPTAAPTKRSLPAGHLVQRDDGRSGRRTRSASTVSRIGDDWENVDLRHVASRRNVGGLSLGVAFTDLSASDPGKGDTGKGDTGKGDTGKGDTGKGDTGKGDTGKGDTGKGDTGSLRAPFGDSNSIPRAALGNAPTSAEVQERARRA